MAAALQEVQLPTDCIQGVDTRTEVSELLKQDEKRRKSWIFVDFHRFLGIFSDFQSFSSSFEAKRELFDAFWMGSQGYKRRFEDKYIDLVIPRGSNELVRSIKDLILGPYRRKPAVFYHDMP